MNALTQKLTTSLAVKLCNTHLTPSPTLTLALTNRCACDFPVSQCSVQHPIISFHIAQAAARLASTPSEQVDFGHHMKFDITKIYLAMHQKSMSTLRHGLELPVDDLLHGRQHALSQLDTMLLMRQLHFLALLLLPGGRSGGSTGSS